MKTLWQNTNIDTKLLLVRTCIFPIATYGCETWTLNKTVAKRITAFEMKCYRKILRISWIDKKPNKEILQKVKVEEGWLLNTILVRKLKFFGNIKRHSGMERLILEGAVPGKRGREDQDKDGLGILQ